MNIDLMKRRFLLPFLFSLCLITPIGASAQTASPTPISKLEKSSSFARNAVQERFVGWLAAMKQAIKELYFDKNYRGMNLDERFDAAKVRIRSLDYDWQMYRVLVQVAMEFNDSHTRIFLPKRNDHFDYGFTMQTFNKECLVAAVRSGSDAERQGLNVGDRIIKVGTIEPTKRELWKIEYVLYRLDPKDNVNLTVQKIDGTLRELTIKARTFTDAEFRDYSSEREKSRKSEPFKCSELSSEVVACKFYSFSVEKSTVEKMFKQIGSHSKLILDLRGNRGGYVKIEEYLLSRFFDRSVKIADVISRKGSEVRKTKADKEKAFNGELAILLDSESASASEVFSRTIQLEKRGIVIGDISSGSVMTSVQIPLVDTDPQGLSNSPYPLWMNVTIADVVMSDGNRLEDVGVIPDIPLVPSRSALASRKDPILATAANRFGITINSEQAGKLLFLTEKDYDADDEPTVDPKRGRSDD